MPKEVISRLAIVSVVSPFLFGIAVGHAKAQQVQYSTTHRSAEHAVSQTLSGATPELRAQLAVQRSAISVAVGDVDRDGTQDLITGYAVGDGGAMTVQRGVAAATAPTGADWVTYTQGRLPAPFSSDAKIVTLPVRPDLLKVVDLNGDGAPDVLVARRGDSAAYVLLGDGKGGFGAAQVIALGGGLSALTTWRAGDGSSSLVAGVCGSAGCSLQVLASDGALQTSMALPAIPTAFEVAPFNGGGLEDIAVVAGGSVLLFDGTSVAAGAATEDTLPIQNASAIASGGFVYDRRGFRQMAVLDADGTLHVLARVGVDSSLPTDAESRAARRLSLTPHRGGGKMAPMRTGMAWTEVETLNHIAPAAQADTPTFLLRGHLSGSGADDLAIAGAGKFVQVSHSSESNGVRRQTVPAVTIDSTSNPVTSAVLARLSPDSQQSTITADGRPQPAISIPPTNKTFTVTTATDGLNSGTTCISPAVCSLRDAIGLANADSTSNGTSKVDVINVPAGTYRFTTAFHPANDSQGNINYHYDVDGSVDIVGAGSATTIIDGGNLDKIFSFDSGVAHGYVSYDIFLSGLTIQNGTNNNDYYNNSNLNDYGGLADWTSNDTGYLTFNNCVLTNGTNLWGPGGALIGSNNVFGTGGGTLEIDNSTISNSGTAEFGGGLAMGEDTPLILNTVTFSGNSAKKSVSSTDPGFLGEGGGLEIVGGATPSITASQITITNSTFSGNGAAPGDAGGMNTQEPFTMSGSTFSGNTATTFGGGLVVNLPATGSTITSSTFTTNTAGTYGGAIAMDAGTPAVNVLTMNYSRIHGNTATTNPGVEVLGTGAASGGTITATNDWWGCNGPGTGTSCDTSAAVGTGATFTATPYTTLVVTVPATPSGSASFPATASMAQNSASTAYTGSQDNDLSGIPATLVVTQHDGTVTHSAATALSSTDIITMTATPSTALTAPGAGTAVATVDGFSVTATFTLDESDMTVTSAHTGNFFQGSTGDVYTLTASNVGNISSSGTVTVVDTLPSGFTATAMSGTNWTCNVATVTCTTTAVATTAGALPAITLTVSVSSGDVGTYSNSVTVSGGSEIDLSNDTATDSTLVVEAPTFTQAFSPTSIAVNGTSTVTFTIGNPSANPLTLTGLAFSDTLPANLKVAAAGGSTTCISGTVTAVAASGSISLSGASLSSGGTCTVTASVTSATAGIYTNTTGTLTSTNGPAGPTSTATLTVLGAPTSAIAFGASTIPFGSTTTLTFTITNPNTGTALAGVAFTDTLPSGLIVATPTSVTGACGGTVTAVAGSSTITLAVGTLASSANCQIVVNVTGSTAGVKNDSVTSSATTAGSGNTANASVTVSLPASKLAFATFPASPINAGGNAGSAVTVNELDSTNALVTTATDIITLTVTGPGSYSQVYTSTAVNGVATFNLSAVPLNKSGSYTYTATFSTFTQAQTSETVNAGTTATGFTVTGLGPFTAPGIAGTATVSAVDSFGNIVTGFTGTVTLTSSDTQATLPAAYTFTGTDDGVHVFAVTLNTAGTETVTATSSAITGTETGIVVEDAIWVLNKNATLARLTDAGVQITTTGTATGTSTLGAVAFDNAGEVWVVDNANSTVTVYTRSGSSFTNTVVTGSGPGINTPTAIAIDGLGNAWIANGNNTISVVSNARAAVSPSAGYQNGTSTISTPTGIVIDNAGSVWISNGSNNSVTKIIGGAAPVTTPTVTGTTNTTLGVRP